MLRKAIEYLRRLKHEHEDHRKAPSYMACSDCFLDRGLRLDAERMGIQLESLCPNCRSVRGRKLDGEALENLAQRFFVKGSIQRFEFGAAPRVQFNKQHFQNSDIQLPAWLRKDSELIEKNLGIGFFHYGPRYWMFGEVEPLKDLQKDRRRHKIVRRILKDYPSVMLSTKDVFYRLRVNPENAADLNEFDSPPNHRLGSGRLDSIELPILYGSQDIEGCVHECRVTVEDDLFLATLQPTRELKLLDLTELLNEGVTEFESLDIAVHMLFFAGSHSYEISRSIARATKDAGFDGLIYPSFFSQVRSGAMPFATVYGLSVRRIPGFKEHAKSQVNPNIAIFGRPIADGIVKVTCVNRLILNRAIYEVHFGPGWID